MSQVSDTYVLIFNPQRCIKVALFIIVMMMAKQALDKKSENFLTKVLRYMAMAEEEKSFRYRPESCLKKVLLILMTKRKRTLQDKKGL